MTEHGRNYNTDLFRCDQAISHLMHPDQIERAIDHRLEEAASTFRRSGDEFIFNDAAIRELFRAGEGLHARLPEAEELEDADEQIKSYEADLEELEKGIDQQEADIEKLNKKLRKAGRYINSAAAATRELADELECSRLEVTYLKRDVAEAKGEALMAKVARDTALDRLKERDEELAWTRERYEVLKAWTRERYEVMKAASEATGAGDASE